MTTAHEHPKPPGPPRAEEPWFPLAEAVNLADIERKFGAFTPEQRAFLEKHRFLLAPRTEMRFTRFGGNDEMLEHFDAIPVPQGPPMTFVEILRARETRERPVPLDSDPAGGRLFNPDIIQHALHMYLYRRMRVLERRELFPLLRGALTALLGVALRELRTCPTESRGLTLVWLLIPSILLRAGQWRGGATDEAAHEAGHWEDEEPSRTARDTLAVCLNLASSWRRHLDPTLVDMVTAELSRIHAAEEVASCRLPGLTALFPARGDELDYTAFRPRGHYVGSSKLRAWFRAMIWFSHLGFALDDELGLACALDFADLLEQNPTFTLPWPEDRDSGSEDDDDDDDDVPRRLPKMLTPREALARIMNLIGFFHGSPEAATLEDWLALLHKTRPCTPEAIRQALPGLLPGNRDFACLRRDEEPTRVLALFPARFSVPWRIADALTAKNADGLRELPERFSALWLPAVFGSERALACMEGQMTVCLRGGRDADGRGGPLSGRKKPAPSPAAVRAADAALKREMADLQRRLAAVPPEDWGSSIAALRMRLLTTQTSTFRKGFPLYMQSPLFGAKQLETFMGAYTELRHDTLLYEKPLPTGETGLPHGWLDVLPVPSARCFVEPNLPFWRTLRDSLTRISAIFQEAGVFSEDLEEDGSLRLLCDCVDLCAAFALKELNGEEPGAEEHWALYHMKLDHLASPLDDFGWGERPESEWRAGLIADVRSKPDGPWSGVTYEALAVPYFMFVLAGSGESRRIVTGLAYNHREFVGPFGRRLNDLEWQARAYSGTRYFWERREGRPLPKAKPLPEKNFWYEGLVP